MTTALRTNSILRHLKRKLTQLTPTAQAFVNYREQIVEDGSEDLRRLSDIEKELSDERIKLRKHIKIVKDNEKKKAFACSTQKLVVVEKKLKEISKQLHHKMIESVYVKTNLDKMIDIFNIMKQRIDWCYTSTSTGMGHTHTTNRNNDNSIFDSTIQKKEEMKVLESNLTKNVRDLCVDEETLKAKKLKLVAVKESIKEAEVRINAYIGKTDSILLKRQKAIQDRKEYTYTSFNSERDEIKEKQVHANKTLCHNVGSKKKSINSLEDRLSIIENKLALASESHSTKMEELHRKLDESTKSRETNLKALLELRVKLKYYEEEQEKILEEKAKLWELEMAKQKSREASELISNRLSLLYKSKYRNKVQSKGQKKKAK